MNGGESPKSHKTDSALDKLSSLPSLIIDQILCRLPIRDAVRTSVLSSNWRFKWTTMSDLVFDNEPSNFIVHALLLHTGTISKFTLDRRNHIRRTHLDRWILHLSRCHVQKFDLKLCTRNAYVLHSSLFSFQDLVHLELDSCHLKLPSTFGGFKKLKRLELSAVDMTQDAFETLISNCPILERLTSLYSEGFNLLNIDAPNLLKIDFYGTFYGINLIKCSNLEEVSIQLQLGITADATERIKAWNSSNLPKFFSSLPRIKRLVTESLFLQYLGAGDIPRQLPNPCTDLGYLSLEICNDNSVECSVTLCLLRSSPNIQELNIQFLDSPEGSEFTFWETKHKNCSLNKLQMVTIYADAVNKNNLELIGFLLAASPVLQKMTIRDSSQNHTLQLAEELLWFQRSSTKTEVVIQ